MRGGKRRDIEGLRALAVVFVLLYHAQLPWFGGGFVGVDVFFVISGFLITGSLVTEAEAEGTIRLGRFYARRARRLLPAAAVVLLTTAVAVRLLLPVTTWRDLGGDISAAAAYVVNWRLALRSVDYLAEDVVASPVQHFWSLAIEEQFYLVWPLLLLVAVVVARRRGWPLPRVLLVVLGLGVAVPSLAWSVVHTASLPARAFFDTGTRMWELAAGGLVALAPSTTVSRSARVGAKAVALVTLVAAAVLVGGSTPWPGWAALVAVVPTALLLHLGGGQDDVVERVLSLGPLQRVGAWSYSLYLWHWPPLAVLAARWDGLTVGQAVGITLLSVVPAVLSYRLVENPVRFQPRLLGADRRSLALGAGLSLVGIVAGLVVLRGVPAAVGDGASTMTLPGGTGPADAPIDVPTRPAGPTFAGVGAAALPGEFSEQDLLDHLEGMTAITPAPVDATVDLPRVYEDGCQVPVPVEELRVCEYGDPEGAPHLVLVGDSKAGQWGDALQTIGERRGWRLTYLLKSGCELSTAMPDLDDGPNPSCAWWNEQVMAWLREASPTAVVTSQVSGSAHVEDGSDPVAVLVDGMVEAYRQLAAGGAQVVVLMDNHHPGRAVYECVAEEQDLRACTFPRQEGSGGRGAQAEAAVRSGVAVVDLADHICPTPSCPPAIGGVLLYRQGSHLTRTYVDTLTPILEERLLTAAGLA